MPSLSWTTASRSDGAIEVALTGDINESSQFGGLLDTLKTHRIVFNLKNVARINSVGVRQWIQFIDHLKSGGSVFSFEQCSVPFVAQMNMIRSFTADGLVKSVFAPFYCTDCNKEHPKLIDLARDAVPQLNEAVTCPACGSSLEFDDLPEHFLTFTQSATLPRP